MNRHAAIDLRLNIRLMFPASAGMNRRLAARSGGYSHDYVPRERGDEPDFESVVSKRRVIMFPASAGMNRAQLS